MLTIRRHTTKNYRKPLLHLPHVAFLFVVVVFFFVTAVDSTSVTTATDEAAAAVAATATADKLISADDSLVEHEHEENSNYAVLRGTSSSAVTAGKLSFSSTSNYTVPLASHQRQQYTQKKQQSQKEEEKENLTTPTKFIGVDYQGDPVYMPLIGNGTWQYDNTTAYESVCQAFGAGYNFVDTAYGYKNQQGVGKAIKDCWKGNRTDLFVMTKIPGGLNSSQTQHLHERNLEELGLDYVDHLMIHYPSDWYGKTTGAKQRQEEWLALEAIYQTGEARTIGISHYCSRHILDVLWVATITPAINQVEYHIGSQDIDSVMETCSDFGITFMSFSPLCGPCTYEPTDSLVNGDLVTEIAKQYKHNTTRSSRTSTDIGNTIIEFDDYVTGSQVALAYIVQQGIPVIPKSNSMAHIISNQQIFDFVLSDEHMERLKRTTKPSASPGDCDVVVVDAIDVDTIEEKNTTYNIPTSMD